MRSLIMLMMSLFYIGGISFSQNQESLSEALHRLLLDTQCHEACYLGIQPSVTTLADLNILLANLNITPVIQLGFGVDPENSIYFFDFPESNPFKRIDWKYEIRFVDGIVYQIYLPWDVEPEILVEAFGFPDIVYSYQSNLQIQGYTMVYRKFGISIPYNLADQNDAIFLASNDSQLQNEVNRPSGMLVDQTCTSYITPPCFFPTATPTPLPTPLPLPTVTPTPPVTPAPLVRLRLTSMCSSDPSTVRVWRVRNPNAAQTLVTWDVVGTAQTGSLIVPAAVNGVSGEALFQTVAVAGSNTTRLFLNSVQQDVKASGGAVCP